MALCLGTAQLAQDYGLFKKPKKETVFDILSAAVDGGIEYIDTAPFYGNAESLIGTFLQSNGLKLKVITKIPSYKGSDRTEFTNWCKSSALSSMRSLGRGQVWAVLLHDPQNAKDFPNEMMGLRAWFVATGVVNKFGVSLYEPQDIAHRMMGIYQFPLNMLDTRFIREVPQHDMIWNGNTIMVRSVYLQGRIEDRQTAMAFAKRAIAARTKHSLIVIGADKPEFVKESIDLYNKATIDDVKYEQILKESEKSKVETIDPRKWK